MKRMKRLLAMLMAVVMVMAMGSMSVMADDATDGEYQITITGVDSDAHIYDAYMIFSGHITGGAMANVTWGSGIKDIYEADGETVNTTTQNTILSAISKALGTVVYTNPSTLAESTPFASGSITSAADVAAALALFGNDSEVILTFAEVISAYLTGDSTTSVNKDVQDAVTSYTDSNDGLTKYSYTFSGLKQGYYLVKDVTEATADAENVVYSNDILVTAGSSTTEHNVVTVKSEYPTVTKTASDYSAAIAGEAVTFTLTGTIPTSVLKYYDTYTYIFT